MAECDIAKVYFGEEDDIINPCWDNVFKATFTKETPESRGNEKSYKDLKHVYQISILVREPVIADDAFFHSFHFYDEVRHISLNGIMHIVTLELAKLDEIVQKDAAEMTALERWSVFFRYARDKEKRELINRILQIEEGIAMAGQVLLSISKDEIERVRLESEYKYAVDLQSKMADARRKGEEIGLRERSTERRR